VGDRIENFNITTYTSVIPRQAYEVPIAVARTHFEHGAVLEAILASMNGTAGEIITAGVGRVYVYKRATGEYLGGFAAEYAGHADPEGASKVLRQDLTDMVRRRYRLDAFEFRFDRPVIASHRIRRSHGTVLAGLCWLTFTVPSLSPRQSERLANAARRRWTPSRGLRTRR
jgi:arginine decarboxylase